jgi:hypothetical protein
MDCSRLVENHNRQARVIVEVSVPKRRRKFFAVLDSLTVKRKAHLKPVNSANGVFHIEVKLPYQHPGTLHDVRLPSVQFDR